MTSKIYLKNLPLQLIFIACICMLFSTSNLAFAGEDNDKDKQNPFQVVLGRNGTNKEKDAYLNLERHEKIEALRNDLLPREQQLVVVRALLAVGEAENSKKILEIVHFSEARTYIQLVEEFRGLKNSHGTVLDGIESEQKYKLSEEEIFKQAAGRAYEEVFCTKLDSLTTEEQNQLAEFLKGAGATQFDQMVKALVDSMDEGDKRNLINRVLDEVGRTDLKENKEFVDKMVSQQFTCKNLRTLFEKLRG